VPYLAATATKFLSQLFVSHKGKTLPMTRIEFDESVEVIDKLLSAAIEEILLSINGVFREKSQFPSFSNVKKDASEPIAY
jgi:hypothetical protein